ncbi:MAG: nucleotide exchange factor GrpE, partial [Syntrophus sp. (in: bacteria)]|nr:nucleotide exchange factor GrpE [Syntrophus sp. (in: bacteria)]
MVKKTKKETAQGTQEYPETQPEGNAAGDDKDTIETLMQQFREKEKEAAENHDKYVRAVAELENYKKRAARDRADSLKF